MDKATLLRTLQEAESLWRCGNTTDAYTALFRLLGIAESGTYPRYAALELAISRLLRQVGVRDEPRSISSALWTACKILAEGMDSAYQMGLINLATSCTLLQRSIVMSDLGQIQTAARTTARSANARKATADRIATRPVLPCTCGQTPHRQPCPVYFRTQQQRRRAEKKTGNNPT